MLRDEHMTRAPAIALKWLVRNTAKRVATSPWVLERCGAELDERLGLVVEILDSDLHDEAAASL